MPPDTICHLNGDYLPLSQARLSPLDRGFLYADGAYEVIPVYSRHPFRLDEHLDRLQSSLDGIRLANPHGRETWKAIVRRLVDAAPFADQSLYLQVTRGADDKRDMSFPPGIPPTVFLFVSALIPPTAQQRERGVGAITVADIRWGRSDLKTLALLPNVLARQSAIDAGCVESILIRDGHMTEGAASNIFIVKNDVIAAPPKGPHMLPGTTYDIVLELAARHGAPCEIRAIAETELRQADELWLTSSTKEVLAIVTLDGRPVGAGDAAGKPGPVTRRMHAWYCTFRDEQMRIGHD